MKFNKILSQLEAIYQVSDPVVKQENPVYISDYIHNIFENQDKYNVKGLSKEWFINYINNNKKESVDFINNILESDGNVISKKSILEGIQIFQSEDN